MDSGAESYHRFREQGDESGLAEIIRDYKDGLIFYLSGYTGDETGHWHVCARCGAVESSRHNFVDGICLSCGAVSSAVANAKTAAKAALNDKAGAKQSSAMKLIVREGEKAIDAAKTLSAVTLARNTALASVETRLLLEKPVTTVMNALTKLFR